MAGGHCRQACQAGQPGGLALRGGVIMRVSAAAARKPTESRSMRRSERTDRIGVLKCRCNFGAVLSEQIDSASLMSLSAVSPSNENQPPSQLCTPRFPLAASHSWAAMVSNARNICSSQEVVRTSKRRSMLLPRHSTFFPTACAPAPAHIKTENRCHSL